MPSSDTVVDDSSSPQPAAARSAKPVQESPRPGATLSYVLDTNVLLHDPTALFRFAEHDVHLPLAVIEELDAHKKGLEDLARNAREVTRQVAALLTDQASLVEGIDLNSASGGSATGRLFLSHLSAKDMQTQFKAMGLVDLKPDNQILATAQFLASKGNAVVLVTKDVNLRVKAIALNIKAQDYRTDRIVSDTDLMTPGFERVDAGFWTDFAPKGEAAFFRDGRGPRSSKARIAKELAVNSFLVDSGSKESLWRVESCVDGESLLHAVHDRAPRTERKRTGAENSPRTADTNEPLIYPRDAFQSIALELLHDVELDAVSLVGKAGTGKTLLALAAGLEQVRAQRYTGIVITRATVSVGDDIGFLPGTEEEKMNAWLGGTLEDCLEVLGLTPKDKSGATRVGALPREISVRSMSFMRGRSFHNKFIIVDEAQNLTQRQMRTLLTRAGSGTKIVLTGNTEQIDTPYLDEASSGLVWAVRKLTGWKHGGHIILPNGTRSRLATHIEQVAQAK